jgi:hypothetical protein
MDIHIVVAIDVTEAVDASAMLDDYAASRIAHQSSGWPEGATIRLIVGNATGGTATQLREQLKDAGDVVLEGSDPRGLRILGSFLNGIDPYAAV